MFTPGYEWIGIRRLYDAIGAELSSDMYDWEAEISIGRSIVVGVYFGPKPRYGIVLPGEGGDKYIVIGKPGRMAIGPHYPDATQSGYPSTLFTEIVCLKEVAVPLDLSHAFWRNEAEACDQLVGMVDEQRDEYLSVLDLVAGTIGLRYHPQLVRELINENAVAAKEPYPSVQMVSPGLEVMVPLNLTLPVLEHMKLVLNTVGAVDDEEHAFMGSVLSWLMRAWPEREIVNKFVALFIPLEMVLNDYGVKNPPDVRMKQRAIRNLIKRCALDNRDELLAFFDEMAQNLRPPLTARFEKLANEAKLQGWESDIEAFRRFNSIRNDLVHRGKRQVKLHLPEDVLQKGDVAALEDLTERYVSFALFGDAAVYQSPWRPARSGA